MSNGFSVHKEAVLMEIYLNDIMRFSTSGNSYGSADITMIYDAPVLLIKRMLAPLKQYMPKTVQLAISELEQKYQSCENQILTQMEKTTTLSLCSDLKMISSLIQSNNRY